MIALRAWSLSAGAEPASPTTRAAKATDNRQRARSAHVKVSPSTNYGQAADGRSDSTVRHRRAGTKQFSTGRSRSSAGQSPCGRRDQFRAARDEWAGADPAQRDPRTQFYIGYACYREGWGRVYYDDALFKQGLEAVNRAINLAPNGSLTVDDPNLQMQTAAELKTELEQGIERSWNDLNPLKLFRQRK